MVALRDQKFGNGMITTSASARKPRPHWTFRPAQTPMISPQPPWQPVSSVPLAPAPPVTQRRQSCVRPGTARGAGLEWRLGMSAVSKWRLGLVGFESETETGIGASVRMKHVACKDAALTAVT